jgi:hypothetical protein
MTITELIKFLQSIERDYGDYQVGKKEETYYYKIQEITSYPDCKYLYSINNLTEDIFIKDGFRSYDDFTNNDKVIIFE